MLTEIAAQTSPDLITRLREFGLRGVIQQQHSRRIGAELLAAAVDQLLQQFFQARVG